ncbi:MAG TPA: hypothetical protein VNA57_11965 [Acidimicrobiales bacterium]|nr:hypothetical protein [Acidimicrobiales bacterium]
MSEGLEAAASPAVVPAESVVLRWNEAVLKAVRTSSLGPPMVARALAIVHTCIYDAWAAYDPVAVGTRFDAALRQPPKDRTLSNANKAVSFAAYRAAVDVFPASTSPVFDPLMKELGYNRFDSSSSTSTPAGVGNVACRAVLKFRHHDGSNQLGDEPGGTPGVAYSDYTGYRPVNEPMNLTTEFDPGTVQDANRWQPLSYRDATGAVVTPSFVAPFWNRVTPFALQGGGHLRSSAGPAAMGSPQSSKELAELVATSAALTDEHKVIAEYWADGPRSELPPGHWNLFAQYVSRRDGHGGGLAGLASDAKLFFALTNAVFDAGIVAWDNKIAFDSVRPITAVRHRFQGTKILAWGGPYRGTQMIDGEDWLPYQPFTFPTPPFAEYSSGHSNFSSAAARVLELATGSDAFGYSETISAGSSKVEPGAVPAADMTLSFPTFTYAADQAGISRRYGGIHFERGDVDARATGARTGAWRGPRPRPSSTGPLSPRGKGALTDARCTGTRRCFQRSRREPHEQVERRKVVSGVGSSTRAPWEQVMGPASSPR